MNEFFSLIREKVLLVEKFSADGETEKKREFALKCAHWCILKLFSQSIHLSRSRVNLLKLNLNLSFLPSKTTKF